MIRTAALLLLTTFAACGSDREVDFGPPRVVAVDKRPMVWGASARNRLGVREVKAPSNPATPGGASSVGAETPLGWEELPANPARFRNAVWRVAGEPDTDCYLTLGVGGGAAFNVQRWYQQFGMKDAPPVTSLGEIAFGEQVGRLVELNGTMRSKPSWAALIAFTVDGQQVTSLKFTGPQDVVASQRGAFLSLARSLRLGGGGVQGPAEVEVDPSQPLPPDHVPVVEPSAAPFAAEAPAGWSAVAGSRRAAHHRFGAQSEVYVSQLGGDLRQTLDIWRFEFELEAMTDAEFEALPRVSFLGDDALLIDLSGDWRGMSGDEVRSARALVAARRDGDTITFCKLVGPGAEVSEQRDAFVKFCNSVRRQ